MPFVVKMLQHVALYLHFNTVLPMCVNNICNMWNLWSVCLHITEFQNTAFLLQNLNGRELGTGRWIILKCTWDKWYLKVEWTQEAQDKDHWCMHIIVCDKLLSSTQGKIIMFKTVLWWSTSVSRFGSRGKKKSNEFLD